MDPNPNEITANELINKARMYGRAGKQGRALTHYIQCICLFPTKKDSLEAELTRTLMKWGMEMYDKKLIPQLFKIYEKSLQLYPCSAKILNDLGTHVYRLGYHKKACGLFFKAHTFDSSFAMAERNLNHVKNLLVERWHFRMLNDAHRNGCYRDAIAAVTTREDIVLDIGTGSGLLSLLANECKPKAIISCEESETMYEMAMRVLGCTKFYPKDKTAVNKDSNIKVINKLSKDLTVEDIGGKITLLITEIFDAAVFGEGILQTLIHAHEKLLSNESRVLPKKVLVYCCAIESTYIASKKKVLKRDKSILNLNRINIYSATDEPYDTENLRQVKDVKYLTNTEEVMKVEFNDADDVKAFYEGRKIGELANLKVIQDGRLDAFAVWFTLYLNDDILVSTDPRFYVVIPAWDQAIFPVNNHSFLKTGHCVPVQFTCEGGTLRLLTHTLKDENKYTVPDLMVRFLNDNVYISEICDAVSALTIHLQRLSDIHILDLSPVPVLGFLLMQRGAHHLSCVVENENEQRFFEAIARQNNIDLKKLHILKTKEFEYGYCDRKYHVIMNHLFEVCGEMSRIDIELSQRLCVRSLAPGGIILPHNVSMHCKLFYSEWLEAANKVFDANVFHYDIADYMNVYQVTQNICTNEYTLNPEFVGESEILLENCSSPGQGKVIEVKQKKDSLISALFCYFKIQLLENGGHICTNRLDSFMDSIVYMPRKCFQVKPDDTVNIILCTDDDGTINIKLDLSGD